MTFITAALHETSSYPDHPDSNETFEKHLDEKWITEALSASGKATLRKRRLPAEQVVWLVLGMALMRDRPMTEVVSKLDLALEGNDGTAVVASSSITQARQRVGPDPLERLFRRTGATWAHEAARRTTWNDLAVYGVDGSTLRVADSDSNRAEFGLASGGSRGDSGYPLVRLVTLMALRSHLLASAHFGPYAVSEHELCKLVCDDIPDDSVTLVDRNFLAAYVLLGIQNGGTNRHWVTRAKSTSKWEVLESYGKWDKRVRLTVSSMARSKDPTLPKTFEARAVSYKHPDSKGRQWVLTSLLDSDAFKSKDIVALYHERWEIEIGYDEIKTHMLQSEITLRSRTVDGVRQELWGVLITYNLIRLEMDRIAQEADVSPSRISFVTAMRYIRDEWGWCAVASPGSIPKKLRRMRERIMDFVLPERRTQRRYPRAVKVKMSNYAKKRRPSSKKATAK